jgi:hypothetical protein
LSRPALLSAALYQGNCRVTSTGARHNTRYNVVIVVARFAPQNLLQCIVNRRGNRSYPEILFGIKNLPCEADCQVKRAFITRPSSYRGQGTLHPQPPTLPLSADVEPGRVPALVGDDGLAVFNTLELKVARRARSGRRWRQPRAGAARDPRAGRPRGSGAEATRIGLGEVGHRRLLVRSGDEITNGQGFIQASFTIPPDERVRGWPVLNPSPLVEDPHPTDGTQYARV